MQRTDPRLIGHDNSPEIRAGSSTLPGRFAPAHAGDGHLLKIRRTGAHARATAAQRAGKD